MWHGVIWDGFAFEWHYILAIWTFCAYSSGKNCHRSPDNNLSANAKRCGSRCSTLSFVILTKIFVKIYQIYLMLRIRFLLSSVNMIHTNKVDFRTDTKEQDIALWVTPLCYFVLALELSFSDRSQILRSHCMLYRVITVPGCITIEVSRVIMVHTSWYY